MARRVAKSVRGATEVERALCVFQGHGREKTNKVTSEVGRGEDETFAEVRAVLAPTNGALSK